ncbi:MAG: hypothetical protein ACRC2T_12530 [Thermoguttaceae bacterium]
MAFLMSFLVVTVSCLSAHAVEKQEASTPKQAAAKAWFSEQESGWLGGIAGSVIGCIGGILGCACGFCVPRGKGRKIILVTILALSVLGLCILGIGVIALLYRQPWFVWFPFIQLGGILSALMIPGYFTIKNSYTKVELTKMQNQDV